MLKLHRRLLGWCSLLDRLFCLLLFPARAKLSCLSFGTRRNKSGVAARDHRLSTAHASLSSRVVIGRLSRIILSRSCLSYFNLPFA
jgi:hypothetical protein